MLFSAASSFVKDMHLHTTSGSDRNLFRLSFKNSRRVRPSKSLGSCSSRFEFIFNVLMLVNLERAVGRSTILLLEMLSSSKLTKPAMATPGRLLNMLNDKSKVSSLVRLRNEGGSRFNLFLDRTRWRKEIKLPMARGSVSNKLLDKSRDIKCVIVAIPPGSSEIKLSLKLIIGCVLSDDCFQQSNCHETYLKNFKRSSDDLPKISSGMQQIRFSSRMSRFTQRSRPS